MYLFHIYCWAALTAIAVVGFGVFCLDRVITGTGLGRVGMVVVGVIGLYVVPVVVGLLWDDLWAQTNRWTNVDALNERESQGEEFGARATWLSDQLTARLANKDTLVAVSISGGGSRAAYFAAARKCPARC
jgi:hypothetical protein